MNAQVVTLAEAAEHARAELLLPWYANGTLAAAERAEVDSHLARCARCRAELAFQLRLREEGGAVPGIAGDDAAQGWEAMRRRLDARPPAPRAGRGWTGWAWGLQAFATVALLVLALLPQREPYRTLGAAGVVPAANALVSFQPGATEAQMRAALRVVGARIVGGPTVMDAYLLQLPDAGAPALKRLREQPGVAQVASLVDGAAP